ncbi:unnamed protein product [Prorocentrum cordatum]|uniref:Fe2OG dioxygenase domain-containing protein n=1 Tax=Prorocentrum cordatum TaxID=2364126 RepID=A0ABN9WD02_9DINO|nr:unnamed protein product [Polarella glacialis]
MSAAAPEDLWEQGLELKNKGNAAFRKGEPTAALVMYIDALGKLTVPDQPANIADAEIQSQQCSVMLNVAACHLKLGSLDACVDFASQALQLDPKNQKALFRRGSALRQIGRFDDAMVDLKTASELEPKNPAVRQELQLLLHARKAKDPEKTRKASSFAARFSSLAGFASDDRDNGGRTLAATDLFYEAPGPAAKKMRDYLPRVRFRSLIHHPVVHDGEDQHHRRVGHHFYKEVLRRLRESKEKASQASALAMSVGVLYDMLKRPLPGVEASSWEAALKQNDERRTVIRQYGKMMKHPEVYDAKVGWQPGWLHPALVSACQAKGTSEAERAIKDLVTEVSPGVYSFDFFSKSFCELFLNELDNFYASGLPARRPNSMNNYGVVLNDIGWEPMVEILQQEVLQPIASVFFPEEAACFDSHHTFIVRYRAEEDKGLDMHIDDSDVTFNICLGREFTGCGLVFCGMNGAADHRQVSHIYQHQIGKCIMHLGRKRHGADDISTGERLNLIVWNHSVAWRSSPSSKAVSVKESGPPDKKCLSWTHDRDYGVFKEYPPGRENFMGRGWCPPRHAEYDGFRADSAVERGGG